MNDRNQTCIIHPTAIALMREADDHEGHHAFHHAHMLFSKSPYNSIINHISPHTILESIGTFISAIFFDQFLYR